MLAPVILMSPKRVHFLPSTWWLEDAIVFALVIAIAVPAIWLIRGLGEPDGPIVHSSGLPDNAFVFRILPALAAFGLIFVTAYITLPGVLALAFGGSTTQQVTVTTNIVGSVDRPSSGCVHKSVIRDRIGDLFGRLCFDSREDKELARSMGPQVVVDLVGWGNAFGIYYTSTTPLGPLDD
ncbi:MAG: hypothetical protein JNK19_13560 [Tabrizicola sp.]|nr:hypothetical protein [Tabrizicola sp.]